jgi:uncharacterized protein YggE
MRSGGRRWAGIGLVLVTAAVAVLAAGCGGDDDNLQVGATGFDASASAGTVQGVAATGKGHVSVTADEAYVVALLGDIDTFEGGSTDRAQADAKKALSDAGFSADAIEVHPSADQYTPPVLSVEVAVGDLPARAAKAQKALRDGVDNLGDVGLWFVVDDCTTAFGTARTAAMADAHDQAQQLATSASVELGPLASIREASPVETFDGFGAPDPCRPFDPSGVSLYDTSFAPIDASANVDLEYTITATFELGDATRSLSATGTAVVEQDADDAYVVVTSDGGDGSAPSLDEGDQRTLEEQLGALDITKDAIRVEPSNANSGTNTVRVKVPVGRVADVGKQVIDEIEKVTGEGTSGVIFHSSKCAAGVARARQEAFADASKRLDALATAAKVTAGPVVGLVEGPGAALYGGATAPDPCDIDARIDAAASGDVIVTGGGGTGLEVIDADPVARVTVELNVTRAITGASS